MSVRVTGLREAQHRLHEVGARGLDQTHTMEREAERVQRTIRGVPVDTGRLERSVRGGSESRVDVHAAGFTIASDVPYARFVFSGTSKMPARPPTFPDPGPDVARAVARDIGRAR